ncbi:uncharacterized protein LOC143299881 [Babylonia areolata]|uniref:uncharacterized protein LOC143299881 n=1 Tax=Babylonia areolata TaxID=304850 RepID=UPI003FD62B47
MKTPKLLLIFTVLKSLLLRDGALLHVEEARVSILKYLNGYIFENKVLFDQATMSPVHCAHACLSTPHCVTFSITPSTVGTQAWAKAGQAKCRGHSAVMRKGNDASQHVLGSHVFVLKERVEALVWLNRSCVADSKCPARMSQCFSSRCLCKPGYYYSVSRDTCVEGCGKAHLQRDFLSYPGSLLLAQQASNSRRAGSVQRCLELCRADRHCRSVDLDLDRGVCATHYSTARDDPKDFRTSLGSSNWHFQRMCA